MSKVLEFRDLHVSFMTRQTEARVLSGINLSLAEGEILGLVGKTGSGKTVLALCALGIRSYRQHTTGSVSFLGTDLLTLGQRQIRRLRGRQISLVLSNPHSLLDPLARVGGQIANVYSAHHKANRAEARRRAEDMLRAVGISDPERRMDAYPHQLSGGMAQRVVIGMALISSPRLLIADEPTFGLDVTIQAQVLALIRKLSRDLGTTTLLITRDMGVVANFCDRVAVLDEGHIVEQADVHHFFPVPAHPFSRAVLGLASDPSEWRALVERGAEESSEWVELEVGHFVRIDVDRQDRTVDDHGVAGGGPQDTIGSDVRLAPLAGDQPAAPLLELRGLVKNFLLPKGRLVVHAVNGVAFELARGETLALVGESGSGKTTIGRLIVGLERPSEGQVLFDGETINELNESDFRRRVRPRIQMVFQEPFESLNPRMRVRDAILEPLRQWRTWRQPELVQRLKETADQVELPAKLLDAYPHELTSGQQQRAAIARAIAVNPDLLVLDEPTSYLDPMESQRLLRLFMQLQRDKGLSYLFISHDLAKVRWLSHRVAVMYLGRILETGPTEDVFRNPQHPYTEALLSAALRPDPGHRDSVILLKGEIPSPVSLPHGCFFHTRCPYEITGCASSDQVLLQTATNRMVACWRVTERGESLVDMRDLASSSELAEPGTDMQGSPVKRLAR